MSKSSIYETSWTNLVFENKNKEYGAYQLRQENSKTTISALFMGLLLLAALGSVSILINKFKPSVVETVPFDPGPVVVTPYEMHPVIPKTEEPVVQQQQTAAAAPSTSTQLTRPVIVTPDQATPEIATNANNVTAPENPAGTGSALNATPTTGGGGGDTEVVSVAPITNEPVLPALLDKMPEFPGGMAKFYTYVGNNFNRPELDADRTLKVYVSFVIERDGSITDIMVKNDPGYGLGKEAIRVLKSLKTKWIPGVLNGKAVRTAYNLPITIKTEAQ